MSSGGIEGASGLLIASSTAVPGNPAYPVSTSPAISGCSSTMKLAAMSEPSECPRRNGGFPGAADLAASSADALSSCHCASPVTLLGHPGERPWARMSASQTDDHYSAMG